MTIQAPVQGTLEHRRVRLFDPAGAATPDPDAAQTAIYETPEGRVLLAVARTSRDKWACISSEVIAPSTRLSRKRWSSPGAALADVAWHTGHAVTLEVRA